MKRIMKSLAARKIARVGFFTALLGIAAALTQLHALAVKSDSEVKVSARATHPDAAGKQIITVTMDISEGWYIYGNPVKNEEFTGAQTQLTINGIDPDKVQVRYPVGKEKESSSGKYQIYQGKVAIQAALQRPQDMTGPLEVGVYFMCCHATKQTCLAPAHLKFKLP